MIIISVPSSCSPILYRKLLREIFQMSTMIDNKDQTMMNALTNPPGETRQLDQTIFSLHYNLANSLIEGFEKMGRPGDLDQAVMLYQHALAKSPPTNPDHAKCLNNLANALFTRFKLSNRMDDLDQAIVHHQDVLACYPPIHLHHSMSLNNLANALLLRFEYMDSIDDLDLAIKCYGDVLSTYPPGNSACDMLLGTLGNALLVRFEKLGTVGDLDMSIKYYEEALALHPPNHPHCAMSHYNLADALQTRFKELGGMGDLNQMIIHHQKALALLSSDHPACAISHYNIANALQTRFEQLGRENDLDQMIEHYQNAFAMQYYPEYSDYDDSYCYNNLANALLTRFKRLGQIDDLNQAIVQYQKALAFHPPDNAGHLISLNHLANAFQIRFQQLGKINDLNQAIIHFKNAHASCTSEHSDYPGILNNLGNVLRIQYEMTGIKEDIDQAITLHETALALCPTGHPDHFHFLTNLANALQASFSQLGKISDLDQAIIHHQDALFSCPLDHPFSCIIRNNLASALQTRFKQLGRMDDLNQALVHHKMAINSQFSAQLDHSSSLNNLGDAWILHFEQLHKIESLENAITHFQSALTICGPGHSHYSGSLNNFAGALLIRFQQLGRLDDLDQAIKYLNIAIASHPPGHPDHATTLNNLGNALFVQFQQSHKTDDLVQAIQYNTNAMNVLHVDHPEHASISEGLALKLLYLYALPLLKSPYSQTKAFTHFQEAVDHPTSSAYTRFQCAVRWAKESHQYQHSSALTAYSKALTLLQYCLVATPSVSSQLEFLQSHNSTTKSLVLDAAACAIAEDKLEKAVELLEQGRSTLLSNIQGYRHSVEELHISKPNLAIQFKEVSSQLEQLAIFSEQKRSVMSEGLGPVASEKQRQRFHRLSKQRDNLIQKIRQVHGFEDFLQAMPFSTLQKVAVEGPVIIVNTSNYRSDAIILQNFGPPILVPLPKATPAEIETLVSNLSAAVKCNPPSQAVVYQVLRTLWDIVVFPIQKKLGALRIPRNSRIWWCPTSYLCALPLHAAGPYVKGQRNLPDLFISSYTSTLSSLIRGRLGGMYRRSLPQLLIMGQPDDTIPRVKEEIEKIHGLWPTAKVLIGGEANDQTVLSYLKQCPWAHFACHGHARKEPFTSSFQLHNDTELTLLKLMQARLPEAEFAFLSACHSAAGDVEGFEGTPDEVITLASAMQFCGFRGVVGTLWAMADLDGPDITLDFYKYMIEKGGGKCKKAAEGLSYATREMRKRNVSVDRWINFMHIGV